MLLMDTRVRGLRMKCIPALCAIALAVAAAPVLSQIPQADVTGGRIAGTVADGVASFKGIPFAAPPVGALRWKAPQPVKGWSGVKQASTFALSCMQDAAAAKLFN